MKPSEIFGLFIRMVGFLVLVYGLWHVLVGIVSIPEAFFQNLSNNEHSQEVSIFECFALGVPMSGFGICCCCFADLITKLTYRNSKREDVLSEHRE